MQTLLSSLQAKGHETEYYGGIAVVGPVSNKCPTTPASHTAGRKSADNCIVAVSDTRKGGSPDGY